MVPVGFWSWPRVATSKMARPAGKPPADAWVASWGVAARAAPGATMAVPTATAAARARGNPRRGRRRLLGPGPGMPAGTTRTAALRDSRTQASKVLGLWRILFLAAVALGLLVVGLIAWSLVRYRRRPGGRPSAELSEHVPLELFYTAVPLVIVAVLFGITMGVQHKVNHLA